jgi:hypothetical protein
MMVLAALVVAAAPRLSAQTMNGWSMVTRYVSDSGRGPTAPTTVAIEVAGSKMRMEFSGRDAEGMYLLIDNTAGTMTSVIPAQQMAIKMDFPGVGVGISGLMKTSVRGDPTIDVEDLGPGENILGLPTRRYHSRTAYTLVITIGDQSCEKTFVTDGEQWMTSSTPQTASAMKTLMSVSGGQNSSAAMKALADATQAKMPGVMLRTIATSTTTTASGESSSVKVRSDVTSFGATEIDTARLVLPAGFNVRDTSEMMKNLGSSAYSAGIIDGVRRYVCGGKAEQ